MKGPAFRFFSILKDTTELLLEIPKSPAQPKIDGPGVAGNKNYMWPILNRI